MTTPKKSDLNSSTVSSSHSPCSSPIAQIKHHAAGNLTGELRKVKDVSADLHNLSLKWNSLNAQGMNIVSQISNIKTEKVFNVEAAEGESSKSVSLPMELNPLCDQLLDIVKMMEKIAVKLENKAEMMTGLVSLQQFQIKSDKSSLLFSTMTLEDVSSNVSTIAACYRRESDLKLELARQLAHAPTRTATVALMAAWLHQPYLTQQCRDLTTALLKETGHIK